MAIDWINNHCECQNQNIAIFTDSQSLCTALLGSSPYLDRIRNQINTVNSHLTIQWIPGHCDIPGNELADITAKEAASFPIANHCRPPVSYGSSCTQINLCIKDPSCTHERTKEVYGALSKARDSQVKTRKDQSILAKLRSGHYVGLRAYQYRIQSGVPDPTCPLCGEDDQDLEHWLTRCPATAARRLELFDGGSGCLDCLTRSPLGVLALARETLGLRVESP